MTSTDITTTKAEWESAELIQTVRHMYAKGATDPEFKIFGEMARLTGLNPMLKLIWCVKNENRPDLPAQIYVSRDGLLAIAHRSGQFNGMESGTKKNEDGDEVGWCTVWRKDMDHPFHSEILRKEYDTQKALWKDKPATMSIKVAEAHCLRRAFDIQGVYTPDEMPEPEPMREVPGASRSVSAIAEPPKAMTKTQPAENCHTLPDAEPVQRCDVCGRSNDEYPALPIRERDGQMICGPCHRKATAQVTHVVEPAPASVKAVPKPAAKVPAPSGEAVAVCEECGAPVTDAQRKTSMLFVSRVLCGRCIDQVNGPQPGEQGAA